MKRPLALLLAFALAFSCAVFGISAEDAGRADIDRDGDVDSDDAIYLLRSTLFSADYPVTTDADFTGDGEVRSDDAIYLLRHVLFPGDYPVDDNFAQGLAYTVNADGKTCTVTGIGTFTGSSLNIPSNIDGYTVTAIGADAFKKGYNFKSITLPKTLVTIGDTAFGWCDGVKTIEIPDSVTSIANDAFYGCTSLTSVKFGDGVKEIGSRAFRGCTALTSVTIPGELTVLNTYLFYGCTSLKSLTLLTGISQIKDNALGACAALEDIYFPGGAGEWEDVSKAASWDAETGDYTVHCTDGDICSYSAGLKYRATADGAAWTVTDIGTFTGESLIIPSTYQGKPVTGIGREAFSGCDGITSVTIPASVKEIDDCAFDGCTSVAKVFYKGQATEWYAIAFGDAAANPLSAGASLVISGATVTNLVVPGTVTGIGCGQFAGCSTIEEVNMGTNVTAIGNEAFGGCKNLWRVTLSGSPLLAEIDDYAFSDCEALQKITLPNSVTSIGRYVFQNCESLTQATLGTGITAIPTGAFKGCMSLTTVTISGKITSIGSNAFAGCISLGTIKFSGTRAEWLAVEKGGSWSNATGKFTVQCTDGYIYPATDGLTYAANGANYSVTGYTTKPETILTIPASYNGSSVVSVGKEAFKNCNAVINLTIPATVTSIGDKAFYGCSSLTTIIFNGTKAQWNAVSKGTDWNYGTGSYKVRCLDGDVNK